MIPLFVLAAATLLTDIGAGHFRPPPHRARGDVTAYFSNGDYPSEAIRRREQGRVIFEVDVDSAGRVSACRITRSSGSTILDSATCRILRERARFEPARDHHGQPVPDQVSRQVIWTLPNDGASARARAVLASYISDSDYPAEAIRNSEQGDVGFQLDVTAEGIVSECRIMEPSGSALLDGTTCSIMRARARFTPARNGTGQAVADTVSARVRWVLPAAKGLDLSGAISSQDYPAAAIQRREQGRVEVALAISPDGEVAGCTVTHGSGSALLDARTCALIRARGHFTPAEGATSQDLAGVVNAFVDWVLPEDVSPPASRANLASYVSDSDYPAEAIRAREQGTVGFELTVGRDGRVSACRIVTSSHSASLDATTCRIMTSRARFSPARDSSGNPTEDRVSARIRWVLPAGEPESIDLAEYFSSGDYPAEALRRHLQGRVDVSLTLSPDGEVTQCVVMGTSGSALLDARTCEIARARIRFSMIRRADTPATSAIVFGFVRWTLPTR